MGQILCFYVTNPQLAKHGLQCHYRPTVIIGNAEFGAGCDNTVLYFEKDKIRLNLQQLGQGFLTRGIFPRGNCDMSRRKFHSGRKFKVDSRPDNLLTTSDC